MSDLKRCPFKLVWPTNNEISMYIIQIVNSLQKWRPQFLCRSNEKNYTVFNLEKGRCFHANDEIKGSRIPLWFEHAQLFKWFVIWTYCGRRCLAALNKFHKSKQNEIERIRGIVLKNFYTCDFDIDYSSEPSSNKL